MKRRIEELVHGNFTCEAPKLTASVTKLQLVIPEGNKYKGSFSLGAEDGSKIRGLVVSNNHRILVANEKFAGNTCNILFGIDTEGMREGESVEGEILILSNLGELTLPVEATLQETQVASSEGCIQTLEDFTKLCMKDLREGFRLFTNERFVNVLNGKNRMFLALYKGMSHNPVTYQHLEEFLVSAGKKEAVTLSLDKQQKAVYRLEVSQKDTLYIYKNTWGYVRMEIEVSGDFLQVEKKVITSDDFIGRVYGLEYVVCREKLGKGKKFGRIRIRNVYQVLDFEIEASAEGSMQVLANTVRKQKLIWLCKDYLSLQLKKMDYRTWYERSSQLVQELREEDKDDRMALFYEIYLAYMNDENAKVIEMLWPIKEGKIQLSTNEEKAAYLSMAKAVNLLPVERQEITPLLRNYYQQQPDSYVLLETLLKEDHSYENMPSKVLYELEQCFEIGCTSPFLYLKAWELLHEQESLLRKLSPFMVQVLKFAMRQEILSEGLLLRAAFLSGHQKEFDRSIYDLLARGYELYPYKEVLEAICKLLMKGNPVKKEYFRWYSLAVEQEIRLTRLYEYYMETLEGSSCQELPRPVRMYFVYNNTLGKRKKAFLYASVIRHKEQDLTSYMNYDQAMMKFAVDSLKKGRINEDYAVLYQNYLSRPENLEAGQLLSKVLFTHKLVCNSKNIRSVVVCHNALAQEQSYSCIDGVAYISLYSDDACILFEDEKRRRFATTVSYTVEKLMEEKESARICTELGVEDTGLELYCCKERAWQMEVTGRNLQCYQKAADNQEFSDTYRRQVRKKLLEYYVQHKSERFLQNYLCHMDFRAYAMVDKGSMAEILIEQGMYEEAFLLATEFGYEGIPVQRLLKLASRLILDREFEEDEELLCLTVYVYQAGKYDEAMLGYLREYFMSSMEELCVLWQRLRGFQMETYGLDERILVLSLFVKTFPEKGEEILENYILQQGRESVITAFLTNVAVNYFLSDSHVPVKVFRYLEKICERGWELDQVCKLALLKHYSTCSSLTGKQEQQIKELLSECNSQGLRFEFYSHLPSQLIQAYQIEDKVFIEERFRPGSRVIIHYQLQNEGVEDPEWISEPMKEMYQGIYVKEFLLFYGETLTYYLSVLEEAQIRKTESYQLSLMDMDTTGITRYKLLNKILAAKKLGNREMAEETVRRYQWQDAFTSELFTMMY